VQPSIAPLPRRCIPKPYPATLRAAHAAVRAQPKTSPTGHNAYATAPQVARRPPDNTNTTNETTGATGQTRPAAASRGNRGCDRDDDARGQEIWRAGSLPRLADGESTAALGAGHWLVRHPGPGGRCHLRGGPHLTCKCAAQRRAAVGVRLPLPRTCEWTHHRVSCPLYLSRS
jgi:hypothetical protein